MIRATTGPFCIRLRKSVSRLSPSYNCSHRCQRRYTTISEIVPRPMDWKPWPTMDCQQPPRPNRTQYPQGAVKTSNHPPSLPCPLDQTRAPNKNPIPHQTTQAIMENIAKLRKTAFKRKLETFDSKRCQHAGQQHLPPFNLIKDIAQQPSHRNKRHYIHDVLDQQERIPRPDCPIAP